MAGQLGVETRPAAEDSLIQAALRPGMAKANAVVGNQLRGQHPKPHGVVHATFQVHDVPEALRHGIFAAPRSYSALIRFSNGGKFNDLEPDAHGMAIKLYGVPGPKLMDDEAAATVQDFILVDHPVFFARDVAHFLGFLKLRGEFAAEEKAAVEAKKSAADLTELKKQQQVRLLTDYPAFNGFLKPAPASPLVSSYWSQTPYQLGNGAVKYAVKPAATNAVSAPAIPSPRGLSIALTRHLTSERKQAVFEFCLEVQSDAETMPIEDATVVWPSPEVIVAATITIPPQDFSLPELVAFGEALSFNPWHSLPDHRPLGGINRSRQAVYVDSSARRHAVTGQPDVEPTAARLQQQASADTIRRFFFCFAEGDYRGMQACLHADVHFHDIGFDLHGKKEVGAMWHMICEKGTRIMFRNVAATDTEGSAHWECDYQFKQDDDATPRPVHNVIESTFRFENGLIREHHDDCDFDAWADQALGIAAPVLGVVGTLTGHKELLETKVRDAARRKIDAFKVKNPEYQ